MSVSVSISGEIIESQNYLSNYFVTINSDQTISGTKTFNIENVSSLNAGLLNAGLLNAVLLNASTIDANNLSATSLSTTLINSSTINSNTINSSTMNSSILNSNSLITITLQSNSINSSTLHSNSINSSTLNSSTLNVKQINASSLDVSTLTFDGAPFSQSQSQNQIFGTDDINSNLVNGTILFGKTFDSIPSVIITQYSSSRIVPLGVTNVSTTGFNWAASSNNIGKINWSAGIKF